MSFFGTFILAMEVAVVLIALLSIVLTVVLAVVDRRNRRRARSLALLTQTWRAYLLGTGPVLPVNGTPPAVTTFASDSERYAVLLLFNRLCEPETPAAHGGRAPQFIGEGARRAGLEDYALRLLGDGDDIDKIAALHALGLFGAATAAPRARALCESPETELSRAAAQCLLRIEPTSIADVLRGVRSRTDWGRARIELLLQQVGPAILDGALAQATAVAIREGDTVGTARLLAYVGCCSVEGARSVCRRTLAGTDDSEVVAAALRALAACADSSDAARARRYATDPSAYVRLGALRVLLAVATPEDAPLLGAMVRDQNSWVRRRAAEVLVVIDSQVAGTGPPVMLSDWPDPYARDAMIEARAEADFAVRAGGDIVPATNTSVAAAMVPEQRS